jgi:DNA polymerase-1
MDKMSDCLLIKNIQQLEEAKRALLQEERFACDLEATGLDIRKSDIEGIGLGNSKKQYFIPFPNDFKFRDISNFLKEVFKDKEIIFHNAKYDLELLKEKKFPIPDKFHDTMIMAWLLDENMQHSLKYLAKLIFDRDPKKWSELDNMQTLFRNQDDIVQELSDYCGDDVMNTYDLFYHFLPLMEKEGVMIDYERIELNLIPVLCSMEMRGVKVDIEWLKEKSVKAEKELNKLEKLMKKAVGDEYINIRSPIQLERLIFGTLQYKAGRVTDAGRRSTDNDVLEKIVRDNKLGEKDFIPLLLKFRDLDKIYRTFFLALIEQAGEEGIVHTHYLQHGTRTGRLASNDPNLQNIPTRNDEWNVRKAFIPREGYKFVLADYSQIELRMLAHFSQDINMVKTFMEGGDIHAKTMQLTGTERRVAKAINFGLIYGMGPRTLAHTLGIKEDDAKKYIDKFFAGYPQVMTFIERVEQQTLIRGYVEMITGRKRRFQEIKDKRWFNLIKRQSINTKIQGSAADLIKIAMIRLHRALEPLGAYQLLQIHDEVIIETPLDKVEEVKKIVIQTMESALALRVPVKVSISEGDCWVKD